MSGVKEKAFFETGGCTSASYGRQMSGNPVRIGDGCATVTGYELPDAMPSRRVRHKPLIEEIGKAEVRKSSKSGYRFDGSRLVPLRGTNFSVIEKDEASPTRVCGEGFAECLHSPICRGLKAPLFKGRSVNWEAWSFRRVRPIPHSALRVPHFLPGSGLSTQPGSPAPHGAANPK